MQLPTASKDKRRVLGALATLRGNTHFEIVLDAMKEESADLDKALRTAPVSEEIGKTQGRASYVADFIQLAETAQDHLNRLDGRT